MPSRLPNILAALLLLPLFCVPAFATPLSITDATGTRVTLEGPARRIVSLAPSVTEILFALGLDSRIVGVTEICNYPPRARNKNRIGNPISPNVESVLGLDADLILAVDGVTGSVTIQELRRIGLPVVTLRPRMVASLVEEIRLIGRLTDREDEAKKLADRLLTRIKRLEALARGRTPVSVLYLIWHDPMMTVGPDTFIGEIITRAGGEMIGAEAGPGYFRLGMEAVLLFNPEVIIIGDEIGEAQIEPQRKFWKRWSTIPAVKNNRIHFINADLVHRPGPRIADGMELIERLLHPEAFR